MHTTHILLQVAIHISPLKVLESDRGLVVVGGSVERGDLSDDEDYMYDGDADEYDREGRYEVRWLVCVLLIKDKGVLTFSNECCRLFVPAFHDRMR